MSFGRRLQNLLADERGTLYEIPIILMLVGVAAAITIPDLAKGQWLGALIKLAGLAGVLAGMALLFAIIGKIADVVPRRAPAPAAESPSRSRLLEAAPRLGWFLFFGALGGFATLLVCAFFIEAPAVLGAVSGAAGVACGAGGSVWLSRVRAAKAAPH